MTRRYRFARKLSPDRRQRLMRPFATAILFRVGLPVMGAGFGFLLLTRLVVGIFWPRVNTEEWRFIVPVIAGMFAVALVAGFVATVRFTRWLIRYRSRRHGRAVAMGDVLGRSDATLTRWRSFVLNLYGVTEEDRRHFLATLQPPAGGREPRAMAPRFRPRQERPRPVRTVTRKATSWLIAALGLACLLILTYICALNLTIAAKDRTMFPTPILLMLVGLCAVAWGNVGWAIVKAVIAHKR